MPTTHVSNGFSPLSDRTRNSPDSSPGPSPQQHYLHESHAVETVTLGGFAARACEKCRASKRKCDKKLPYCDRCKRLNAKCHYLQDISNNNVNHQSAQFIIYQPRSLSSDVLFRGPEPLEGVTPAQILSLVAPVSGLGGHPAADWRSAINAYFFCIHPWYAVVHPTLFRQRLGALLAAVDSPPSQSDTPVSLTKSPVDTHPHLPPVPHVSAYPSADMRDKELALLVVAMYLTTRMRMTDAGEQPIFDETYRTVKRLLSSLLLPCVGDPGPSVERVQCGALVALYEYGHGEAAAAYQTLSQTVAVARVLDIKPGLMSDGGGDDVEMVSIEEEQSGCLWWGMFILDQFVHQDDGVKNLPFLLESPSTNTLLPETPPMTPILSSSAMLNHDGLPPSPPPGAAMTAARHLSASAAVGTHKLGGFQLSAKSSCLFHRALRIDKERDARPGKMPLVATYADLDAEIRRTTLTLLGESLDWEATLDCFAMLVSALFMIYLPYLTVLEHNIDNTTTTTHNNGTTSYNLLSNTNTNTNSSYSPSATSTTSSSSAAAVLASSEELSTAVAALRFACKMSTDISCKVNADYDRGTPRSPALLCAPAGNTCYFVILAYASLCRCFPDEQDECQANIAEKFESLKLFSYRWGIAEKMMSNLEQKIGLDRSHYLKNSVLAPPPHRLIFDFGRR
ncbi:hypothetical protein GGR53DRAFT_529943 [Hypoxylon sp. FL1150]|nr:hypothetical protein GGR53DRAFT_529943 [Hypoxylon sp. FL1150]